MVAEDRHSLHDGCDEFEEGNNVNLDIAPSSGHETIQRIRRINGGDREGSFSLNDTTREKDDSIYMDTDDDVIKSLEDFQMENNNTKEDDEEEESNDLPKAPDGGYGWVICCGVFMNHMIYGGLTRCEGLFFLQFQSKFGTTAQLTAWPGSLMSTLNLFMGPVCGAVVSRYSVRTAFMIGTSLCFTGMLLNSFAPNIYFLFLSHTLLGGIGRGFMAGILLLNLYFDKHRSLATGLGSSGVGVGSLWVVPLTQFLFDEFDDSGAFLILSAICLHGFVMAMLFRPLSMHYRFLKAKLIRKHNMKSGITEEGTALTVDSNDNFHKYQQNVAVATVESSSSVQEPPIDASTFCTDSKNEKFSDKLISADQVQLLNKSRIVAEIDRKSLETITTQPSIEPVLVFKNNLDNLLLNSDIKKNNPLQQSTDYDEDCCKASVKICFPIEFKKKGRNKKKISFHWDLLKHVPFMIFCTSNFLFILAFKTAFTFLPAIAMSKGLSKPEAALVLTISGALDTFGRIAAGFIMDLRPLRRFRPYVFNLLLFIIAAASLLIPSLTTFASYSIVCSVYGFMTGAFIAQKMVVLVDILGREKMPSSLGIQKVFQGFGTLIGPPFAGALRDALGSYDSSFYLGGACMLGSGVLLLLSTLLLRIRNKKSIS